MVFLQAHSRDDNKATLCWSWVLCEGNRDTAKTRCVHIIGGTTTAYWAIITGRIPLRELVYRVIDIPPSMRPLVYDFGQLNTDTERDYTYQIVHDHVSVCVQV